MKKLLMLLRMFQRLPTKLYIIVSSVAKKLMEF